MCIWREIYNRKSNTFDNIEVDSKTFKKLKSEFNKLDWKFKDHGRCESDEDDGTTWTAKSGDFNIEMFFRTPTPDDFTSTVLYFCIENIEDNESVKVVR